LKRENEASNSRRRSTRIGPGCGSKLSPSETVLGGRTADFFVQSSGERPQFVFTAACVIALAFLVVLLAFLFCSVLVQAVVYWVCSRNTIKYFAVRNPNSNSAIGSVVNISRNKLFCVYYTWSTRQVFYQSVIGSNLGGNVT